MTPGSCANRDFVIELGTYLSTQIPVRANMSQAFKPWTAAVHESLRAFGVTRGMEVLPEEAPYAGEYLYDFMLHQPGYGIRVACESQWQHWRGTHQKTLDWAFDKLRGVKADVKVFIFEGTEEEWLNVIEGYLVNYAQLSTNEAFLALHWRNDAWIRSWWIPPADGIQDVPIIFERF